MPKGAARGSPPVPDRSTIGPFDRTEGQTYKRKALTTAGRGHAVALAGARKPARDEEEDH